MKECEANLLKKINEKHTLYSIELLVESEGQITVGKLGTFFFPKGKYIYVGSAKNNIVARVKRHFLIDKKLRWHFDYLRPIGQITNIHTYCNAITECELFEELLNEKKGIELIKGFGSSDCNCKTHLLYTH